MPNAHAPSALPRQLRAEAVSLTFSGVRALKSVSLSLERGRVLGLIGPQLSGEDKAWLERQCAPLNR